MSIKDIIFKKNMDMYIFSEAGTNSFVISSKESPENIFIYGMGKEDVYVSITNDVLDYENMISIKSDVINWFISSLLKIGFEGKFTSSINILEFVDYDSIIVKNILTTLYNTFVGHNGDIKCILDKVLGVDINYPNVFKRIIDNNEFHLDVENRHISRAILNIENNIVVISTSMGFLSIDKVSVNNIVLNSAHSVRNLLNLSSLLNLVYSYSINIAGPEYTDSGIIIYDKNIDKIRYNGDSIHKGPSPYDEIKKLINLDNRYKINIR